MTSINKARNSGGYYYAHRTGRSTHNPLSGGACPTFRGALMDMIVRERNADFRACPILKDYIAAMLDDLQHVENDEACTDEREARDSGTIYTLPHAAYQQCKADCEAFMSANARWVERATDLEPGEDGLRYGASHMTHDRIGYYFYMMRVGHGVGFTDDGNDQSLQIMSDYARARRMEGAYFGDNGKVYL